jgi:hypothetical protein
MAENVQGLDKLVRKIETLAQLKAVGGALLAGGAHLKTHMQVYPSANRPTRKSVYGRSFQSDRQRRFFFWAMRKGIIQVPYRRKAAGGLAGRWTVTPSENGLRVEVANATPYGPLMQAKARQTLYAKAVGWQTDAQVLARETPVVVQYLKTAINEVLSA